MELGWVCCCTLSLFLWGVSAGSDNLTFAIWKNNNEPWYEGVLMVAIGGGERGAVCRQNKVPTTSSFTNSSNEKREQPYEFTTQPLTPKESDVTRTKNSTKDSTSSTAHDLLPPLITSPAQTNIAPTIPPPGTFPADKICKRLNFHKERPTTDTSSSYGFKDNYTPALYGLACDTPSACTYRLPPACTPEQYTSISCGCNDSYYVSAEGCVRCTVGSEPLPESVERCACTAGSFWSDGHCASCPANTFSSSNALNCTACPHGGRSAGGSGDCQCLAGLFMSEGVCKNCPGDQYSVFGSAACQTCPGNTTGSVDGAGCVCPGEMLWNISSCVDATEFGIDKGGGGSKEKSGDENSSLERHTKIILVLVIVIVCMTAALFVVLGLVWVKYRSRVKGLRRRSADCKVAFSALQQQPSLLEEAT